MAHPSRWVIAAASLFLGSTLLSTALSTSFNVSAWGSVPGLDSYPAYTIVAHFLVFAAVASHLKTRAQLKRLVAAAVSMGILVATYAIFQHFGADAFDLLDHGNPTRATSTLGNAIVAGSVLALTIPPTVAAAVMSLSQQETPRGLYFKAAGWTLVLGVQLLGLIFTFSRGPWLGVIGAMTVLLWLTLFFAGWRIWIKGILVLGIAAGLCVVVVLSVPEFAIVYENVDDEVSISRVTLASVDVDTRGFPSVNVVERFGSLGGEVARGGLSGRFEIWRVSKRLILQRPWFEFESLSLPWLRPLTGYGPDLFKYTYLLERRSDPETGQLITERFAHNFFIHQAVEQGALGLLSSLGLFFIPLGMGGYYLIRNGDTFSLAHKLVLIGILATLTARIVEQLTGVASVSDMAITWVLLGVFVALPAIMIEPEGAQITSRPRLPTPNRRIRERRSELNPGRMWRPALAGLIIVGLGTFTWVKTIEYPLAAVKAREGVQQIRSGDFPNALTTLEAAVSMAPDVYVYPGLEAAVYTAYASGIGPDREAECGINTDRRSYQICLSLKAVSKQRQSVYQRPLELRSQLALGQTALDQASLEGTSRSADEATAHFRRAVQMDPQGGKSWNALALALIRVEQPANALDAVRTSLSHQANSGDRAISLLIQGIAWRDMGEVDPALESFDRSLVILNRIKDSPDGSAPSDYLTVDGALAEAYSNRGAVLNDLGRYQEAEQDLDLAISLNPELPNAYNNRANTYANLERYQDALADYQEAIRLAPRMALAYYNRALTHTYLGDDQNASWDVERVIDLGLDPSPLLTQIEEAKSQR